jgi:serine/threonine protein kinase
MPAARRKTRIEAIVNGRVEGSPRIVNLYGYCGMTVATQFIGGDNNTMKKATRGMTPEEKLAVGIQLAQAVADIHTVDGNQATLAHNDLKQGNLLFTSDKRPMLQDFGNAVMFRVNKKTGKQCGGSLGNNDWTDVSKLGNLLEDLVIEPWLLNKKEKAQRAEELRRSPNAATQKLLKASDACHHRNGYKLPTATQLVAFLENRTSTI